MRDVEHSGAGSLGPLRMEVGFEVSQVAEEVLHDRKQIREDEVQGFPPAVHAVALIMSESVL